jgi:putative lipoprotein
MKSVLNQYYRAAFIFLWFIQPLNAAASDPADNESNSLATLQGHVWYRERMMLPANAEIKVFLEDVSRMDTTSTILAKTQLNPQGGPPYAFSLQYDPDLIQPARRYALRARIEVDGRLIFINKQHIPAFTQAENKPVNIMVSHVDSHRSVDHEQSSKPDASLRNTYWKLVQMEDNPVTVNNGERELHMVLTGNNENTVRGYSGCNRFHGRYNINDDQLAFEQMASTRRMCIRYMELETKFLDLLRRSSRYLITGDFLDIFDADGKILLRFTAVYVQ